MAVRARLPALLLLSATLAWAAHRALFKLSETDLFFHLKLGEIIVDTQRLPLRNLFSFTYPDHPDPDLAWAFQVLMALAHRLGGFAAIVVTKTLLVVAAVALLWRAIERRGTAALPAALALVMAIEAARPRLVERPHLATFVGLGALALLLAGVEAQPRRWRWLPLLALGWAQLHAGVFLCPLLVLAWALGAAIDQCLGQSPGVVALPWRRLGVALALAVAATFATPAGAALPRYLLWHTGLGATRVVDEFRHADAWNDPWFFALAAAALATAVGTARRRRWRDVLPAALLGLLAWRSVRFVAEWALWSAPLLADGLDRLLAAHAAPLVRPTRAAAVAGVAIAAALLALIAGERVLDPQPPGLADDVVPFDAIEFVSRTGLRRRMFNDLDVGCYLAWQGWPRWSVFEDARLPAYPDELHRALDGTSLAPAAFDALLRRWDVDAALLAEPGINRRAGSFDPDEWALVWRTPSALVFARRTTEHAALIAERELPLGFEFAPETGVRTVPLKAAPLRSPVDACEWDRRLARVLDGDGDAEGAIDARVDALGRGCLRGRDEVDARFYLGARLQRAGQRAAAMAEYDRVLALEPDDARALVNRAWARIAADPAGARADFARARALAPWRAEEIARGEAMLGAAH
jgi:tetratricopeptide (TPR) repeat protein